MKKFKKHIIIAWIWGLLNAFVSGTPMSITITEIIVQPPLFALVLLVPPLFLSAITSPFLKNKEKSKKIFDVLFYIMLAFGILMILNSVFVDNLRAQEGF
jgi:hypothetical protein